MLRKVASASFSGMLSAEAPVRKTEAQKVRPVPIVRRPSRARLQKTALVPSAANGGFHALSRTEQQKNAGAFSYAITPRQFSLPSVGKPLFCKHASAMLRCHAGGNAPAARLFYMEKHARPCGPWSKARTISPQPARRTFPCPGGGNPALQSRVKYPKSVKYSRIGFPPLFCSFSI